MFNEDQGSEFLEGNFFPVPLSLEISSINHFE